MNSYEFAELFPNCSNDFKSRNAASADFLGRNSGPVAVVERDSRNAALGTRQVQKQPCRRFSIRVTSVRKRLLDEDNLCEKYHVDLCRYAGALPGDEAGTTQITVTQRKAGKDAEHTLIEIFEL